MIKHKLYFSILFSLFIQASFAQTNQKTESKEVYIRIGFVLHPKDSLIALIKGGSKLGLREGMMIKAYQTAQPAKPGVAEKKFKEVGSGKLIEVFEDVSRCLIELYDPGNSIKDGDVISLTLQAPVIPYRSIFSELAFLGIEFDNFERKSLYSLQDIFYHDTRKTEDSIMQVILNDIHNTYEMVKDRENLPASLKEKITEGRFKGRTALEILRDATAKDLQGFLFYAKTYTGGYIGKAYRASESFAGWLISNSPYSFTEVKNALFPVYKDKAAFEKLLPIYKKDILAEAAAESFSQEAIALSDRRQYAEALQLIGFARTLAYAVNDTAGKSPVHLHTAQVYQDQDKYEQAISECEKAIHFAVLAGKKDIELQAIMKKAYCQYKISKYAEAKNTLLVAEKKLKDYRPLIGEDVYRNNLLKRYEYEGSINYASGSYTQALKNYNDVIAVNYTINSYDARVKNARIFKFIGNVYNDQGKPDSALEAFVEAAEIYKNINDYHNWGIVTNNIAYSYYNLGNYRKTLLFLGQAFEQLVKDEDFNNAGYSKSLMGSCYWELGRYDSAVTAHKESISLRKKSNNLSGQAFSWKQIGELYTLSGLKKEALTAYDTAARLYKMVKDNSGLAETFNNKGKVFYNDENYKKAVEFYEMARGVDNKTTVEALYNLGNAWIELDTAKARTYYLLCQQKSDSTGNTSYQFFSAKALAGLSYRMQDTMQGDKLAEKCFLLSKQINTTENYAYCSQLKGVRYYHLSVPDSALFYYQQALQAFDTVSRDNAIWELNNMADVYISMGEFSKAEQSLAKAISLAGKINNNLGLGSSLQSASFLYGLLGEFAKGVRANDSAIFIFNRSGNMLRLAQTYTSRGSLLASMGNYTGSIHSYLFADSIYKEELTHDYRVNVLNNIGVTYYSQSDYLKALTYFEKALSLARKDLINESILLFKSNIAECLYYLKKPKEAEQIFLKLYPEAKKRNFNRISSGMAITLGKIYFDAGQFPKAAAYFEEAREYGLKSSEKEKIIDALLYLSRIDQQSGRNNNTENHLRQVVSIVNTYRIASSWEAFYELGLFYYTQKKFDSAIANFKTAVEWVETISANVYGGEEAKKIYRNDPRKTDLYSKIVSALSEKGSVDDAWAYANRSNITGLKDLLGKLPGASDDPTKNKDISEANLLFQQQNALDKKINELKAKPEAANSGQLQSLLEEREIAGAKYLKYIEQLKLKYPELRAYFSENVNPEQFKNYKGLLPADLAVLLYIINDNKLLVFTVTNENTTIHTSELKEDINRDISHFIRLLKNPSIPAGTDGLHLRSELDEDAPAPAVSFASLSEKLYGILVAAIKDKIVDKKKLCIIPNGDLSNIPFQCLGRRTPDSSFRFLVEDYSIFYTNQLDIFKNREPLKENISSFAAFGVPDKTLRFTEKEAESIGNILKMQHAIFVKKTATEKNAKENLSDKKFVHFATHGILNYTDYSQSYLKFLPDQDSTNGNNGKLTIDEIKELEINGCDLVTLSACETAVNKELAKGWRISPANSFLLNRVRSVVATLWKVDDEATSLFMDEFYTNLNSNMDKVDALRLAQQKLSNHPRYKHPFYWGSFILYGDWR